MKINSYKTLTDNWNEIWAYEIELIEWIKESKEVKKYECWLYNKTKWEFTGFCQEEYREEVKKHFKS